jgi:hypothetical protein
MKKLGNNYAFIDSQNLHLGVQKLGWKLDYAKFRTYLAEKYAVPATGVQASLSRSSGVEREPLLQGVKGDIATKFHHMSAALGAVSRRALEKRELGEVDDAFVKEVYADIAR